MLTVSILVYLFTKHLFNLLFLYLSYFIWFYCLFFAPRGFICSLPDFEPTFSRFYRRSVAPIYSYFFFTFFFFFTIYIMRGKLVLIKIEQKSERRIRNQVIKVAKQRFLPCYIISISVHYPFSRITLLMLAYR